MTFPRLWLRAARLGRCLSPPSAAARTPRDYLLRASGRARDASEGRSSRPCRLPGRLGAMFAAPLAARSDASGALRPRLCRVSGRPRTIAGMPREASLRASPADRVRLGTPRDHLRRPPGVLWRSVLRFSRPWASQEAEPPRARARQRRFRHSARRPPRCPWGARRRPHSPSPCPCLRTSTSPPTGSGSLSA